MASVTLAPTRTIDAPDLLVLAAVAAVAATKAVRRFRQSVLVAERAPAPGVAFGSFAPPVAVPSPAAVTAATVDPVPFDEDLMDRFLTGPDEIHDPEDGRLRRIRARRSAGAEAQWRSFAQ